MTTDGPQKECIDMIELLSKSGEPTAVHVDDIVACRRSHDGGVRVVAYPRRGTRRERCVYTAEVNNNSKDERWVNHVEKLLRRSKPPHIRGKGRSMHRALVFVNPHSGSGKARQIFDDKVKPMLDDAGVETQVLTTLHRNHAFEHVVDMDVQQFDLLVIVSGDGLTHEVINGLMSRDDRSTALQIPIGVICGGSANGLPASIMFEGDEECDIRDFACAMALRLARPTLTRLSLTHVQNASGGRHIASFMSLNYGVIADIDIESETYRRLLGPFRFDLLGVIKAAQLKRYSARLSYLPVGKWTTALGSTKERGDIGAKTDSYEEKEEMWRQNYTQPHIPRLCEPVPPSWVTLEDEFVMVSASMCSHIQAGPPYLPDVRLDGRVIYLTLIPYAVSSRWQVLQFLYRLSLGTHLDMPCCQIIPVHAFRLSPLTRGGSMVVDGELIEDEAVQAVATNLYANICTTTKTGKGHQSVHSA